jgi:hypothetical protein
VVVSEETGKMSIAFRGEIVLTKDAKELEHRLGDFLYESTGRQGESAA